MDYLTLKWIYVISLSILIGTGIGSAFCMFIVSRQKVITQLHFAERHLLIADWRFATPALIVQFATGFSLINLAGYETTDPWIAWAISLFFLVGALSQEYCKRSLTHFTHAFVHGLKKIDRFTLILASVALCACTAETKERLVSQFPSGIEIEEFVYFNSIYFNCTFAEVRTTKASFIKQSLIDQTRKNLETLQQENETDPFVKFQFPEGGFAYFQGYSLADVSGNLEVAGDYNLGYEIGEEIFSAKNCWEDLRKKRLFEQKQRYTKLIGDNKGIVIIGKERRHVTIVFFPEQQRAYYFGP